jgi:hypothetical protein
MSKLRTKETETARRRDYRHRHLDAARLHDKTTYARKKIDPGWIRNRKDIAFRERLNVKLLVLSCYGPSGELRCSWPDCNIIDVDMLTLDHVLDNGAVDRKLNQCGCGTKLYRRLRRDGFPKGFQTLCGNHQMKKKVMMERADV